jgi:hypothetical protein
LPSQSVWGTRANSRIRGTRANSRIWLALGSSGWLWVLSKSCLTRRARYNSRRTVVLRADARGITVEEPSFCARAASGWLCVAQSGSVWLWVALAASGCLWLALAGSGWLWVALGGSGWLWLALEEHLGGSGWSWVALGGSGWLMAKTAPPLALVSGFRVIPYCCAGSKALRGWSACTRCPWRIDLHGTVASSIARSETSELRASA